jgi:hypothetical protein
VACANGIQLRDSVQRLGSSVSKEEVVDCLVDELNRLLFILAYLNESFRGIGDAPLDILTSNPRLVPSS